MQGQRKNLLRLLVGEGQNYRTAVEMVEGMDDETVASTLKRKLNAMKYMADVED